MSARQQIRNASMRLQPLPRVSDAPLLLRWPLTLWRTVQAVWVCWTLWEHEHYIRDAHRSGIADSLNLRRFRAEAQSMRVRLIDLTTRD